MEKNRIEIQERDASVQRAYAITAKLQAQLLFGALLLIIFGCERPLSDDVEFATYPATAEVYTDGTEASLGFLTFGGDAKADAFSIDEQTFYEGSAAMRFDIPNSGDPSGTFAGGSILDHNGRDLSGFDALTFWAKASKAATIDRIGFGQYFVEKKYQVTKSNLRVSTGWEKYIIPIPDPSKLTFERGMFWYYADSQDNGEGDSQDNGQGYTFWIDELRYEKLGTIAQPRPAIMEGQEVEKQVFIGDSLPITGLTQTFNLSDGRSETVSVAPGYFTFQPSDNSVVTIDEVIDASSGNRQKIATVSGTGTAVITAILGGVKASGSLTVNSQGNFVEAPVPTRNAANVIAVFSNAYSNIPVSNFNQPAGQKTQGGVVNIDGDPILQYTNLNYVVISLGGVFDLSDMTHVHVDVQVLESLDEGDILTVQLVDFGPDRAFGGSDNTGGGANILANSLVNGIWKSIDIPLNGFTEPTGAGYSGSPNLNNIATMLFVSNNISSIIVDNIYFYKE